ncbi:MAG: amidohydrolase family protein [Acetobacteraceae bacterium]
MPPMQPSVVEHPNPNPAWLAKLHEDILHPDLPIVDPHHHLWDRPGSKYYLDELLTDLNAGHNIVATVFLQCFWAYRPDGPEEMRPVGETEFVASVAAEAERRATRTRVCAAIVGHVDFRAGAQVDAVLEAHVAAAGGRFRGIRQVTARHPDFLASISTPPPLGLMGDPAFRAGFARLGKYGLSFDAWLYHTQLGELLDLARAYPATPIVINHVGGPLGVGPYRGTRHEVFAAWHDSMRWLATCPNVHVKLGGLAMAVNGFDFHHQVLPPSSGELASAWQPWMHACIEAFGADRCMFESNFPVDKAMCSYPVLWNAFKRLAAGASADERRALFHDTAARFYRITV